MQLKPIIWKRNDNSGASAYVGTIKIGSYFYNAIDSKNGKYKGNTIYKPDSFKVDSEEEARKIITL
jgi:hypothetical protein